MTLRARLSVLGFIVFLVVALVLTVLVYGSLRRDTSAGSHGYSALFADVTGLRPGDDVRVAGVRVGRVDTISLDDDVARVGFRLENDQQLYADTIASVRYQNIVGQRYLGLARGPRPESDIPLPPGSELPVDQTEPSFDIGAMINGFEPLFTLLDPEQADALSQSLIDAFQGDSGAIGELVVRARDMTAVFAERDELLGNLIDGSKTATENLARQDATLDAVLNNAQQLITALNERRDTLVSSLGSVTHAVDRMSTIGDEIYPDLEEFIYREPGMTKHLVQNRDEVAFMGSNLPLILKGLARTAESGAYGNAYLCSLNIMGFFPGLNELVPNIVQLASPGNQVRHTPKCRPTG